MLRRELRAFTATSSLANCSENYVVPQQRILDGSCSWRLQQTQLTRRGWWSARCKCPPKVIERGPKRRKELREPRDVPKGDKTVHHSFSLTKYEFSVNGRRHQRWRAFSKHVKKRNCSQYWNAEALCFSDVNLIKAMWPGQEADNTSNQTKRNFKIKIKPKIKKLNGRMFASWRTVSDGKEWQRWAARNAIQEAATLKRFHREKKNKMIPLTSQWQGSELSKFVTWFWPAFTICFLSVSFAPKSY